MIIIINELFPHSLKVFERILPKQIDKHIDHIVFFLI